MQDRFGVNEYLVKAKSACRLLCLFGRGAGAYMLNTRNEETNTVFYSCVACFVQTFTFHMYVSMSYTGRTRRNTFFILLWLRHKNT